MTPTNPQFSPSEDRAGTRVNRPRPVEERFLEKVQRRGPDECWPWLSVASGTKGHKSGKIKVGRRYVQASWMACALDGRPVPKGLCVLHRCDNPMCVNPAHLVIGTHQDNMLDMVRKGRARNGKTGKAPPIPDKQEPKE